MTALLNRFSSQTKKLLSIAFAMYMFISPATPLLYFQPVKAAEEVVHEEKVSETNVEEENEVSKASPEEEIEVSEEPTVEVTSEPEKEAVVEPAELLNETELIETVVEKAEEETIVDQMLSEMKTVEPTLEWHKQVDGSYYTNRVEANFSYTVSEYPGFSLQFTSLPETAGDLIISVVNAPDQIDGNTTNEKGVEITSSMTNGTFAYIMTFPKTSAADAEVAFTEDGTAYEEVTNEQETSNSITFTENHFTTFFVVNPNTVGNGNSASDSTCTSVGVAGVCYDTIQAAINAAVAGDTINIAAGTYNPTSTLNINKSLTIVGSGVDTTIIEASGYAGYGMSISASNISLSGFTFQNGNHYGIKTSNVNYISLVDVKVSGFARSNIDFNGVDYITLTNVQAYNTPFGVGIALTDSNYATLTNITTNGNAWGGVALYTSHYYAPAGVSNITLLGSNSFGEIPGLYSEEYVLGDPITDLTLAPTFKYQVADSALPTYLLYYAPNQFGDIVLGAGITVVDITSGDTVYPDTTAPSIPVLTWPVSGEITNDNTPLMQWEDSLDLFDITSYDYQVRYNCSDTNDVNTCSSLYNTTVPTSQMQAGSTIDNTFFWRVRATDENGNTSAYSDYERFTIDTVNPARVSLLSPVDGAYVNGASLTNEWNPIADANHYVYESYHDAGLTSLGWSQTVNGTSKTATNVADSTFWWRVRAVDEAGNLGDWSDAWSVNVDSTAPDAPTITAPTGNYYNSTPILGAWTIPLDASGIVSYRVEYEYDDGHTFSGAPYRTTTTNSRNHTPAISEQGGVQIRVQAIDMAGNYGAWSAPKHYFYDATAPTIDNVSDIVVEGTVSTGSTADVTITPPMSHDNIDGDVVSTCDATTGNFPYGVTTVACDKTDNSGNIAVSETFTVTVQDTTAPVGVISTDNVMLKDSRRAVVVTIDYSEPMNQTVSPSINFAGAIGTWTNTVSGVWNSSTQYQATYKVSDANEESTSIIVSSTGAEDLATNPEASGTTTFDIDTKNPLVVWTNPISGNYLHQTVSLDVSATDVMSGINYVRFRVKTVGAANSTYVTLVNKDTLAPYTYDWDTTTVADGNYTLRSRANDGVGNRTLVHVNVIVDNTAPIVEITSPVSSPLSGSIEVRGTVTDVNADHYWLVIQNSSNSIVAGPGTVYDTTSFTDKKFFDWDTTSVPDGDYKITLAARDAAGNKDATISVDVMTITVDNTKPVLTLPSNIIQEAVGATGNVVSFVTSANDTLDGLVPVTCIPASGSLFALGITTVNCSATDAAGNTGTGSFDITIEDTTAPSVPANLHFSNSEYPSFICGSYTNIELVKVDWDDSTDEVGVVGYDYNIDYPKIGGGRGNWTTSKTVSEHSGTLNPGLHQIQVRAKDAAGNLSGWTNLCEITYDATAPDVEITSPVAGLVNLTVEIRGTVTDENPNHYYTVVKNSSNQTVAGPGTVYDTASFTDAHLFDWDTTSVPDGVYTIRLEARDAADNKDAGSVDVVTVTVDNTEPVLTLPSNFSDEADGATGSVVTFAATAIDNVDGSVAVTCILASGSLFPIGTTTVNCSATDTAGNTGVGSFDVTVEDTTDPSVPTALHFENTSSTALSCGTFTNIQYVTVRWGASSDAVGVDHYNYFINRVENGVTKEWTTQKSGTSHSGNMSIDLHQVKIQAVDAAGNTSDWTSLCDITYDPTAPTITEVPDAILNEGDAYPLVNVTAEDNAELDKMCFTLDAPGTSYDQSTPNCGYISGTSYLLDVNTWFSMPTTVWTDPSTEASSMPEGDYFFTYWVTDEAGNKSVEHETTYTLNNLAPTVSITAVQNGNNSYTFTANSANGNAPYTYLWSNNCSGTGVTSTTGTTPATYTCTVTVTDFDGETTQGTLARTIAAPAPVTFAAAVLGEATEEPEEEVLPTEEVKDGEILGERTCKEKQKLTGFIYVDTNENKKFDEDEKKLSGVKLEISYMHEDSKVVLGVVETDPKGNWRVDACEGEYSVIVDSSSLPEGYKLGETTVTIKVNAENETAEVPIYVNMTKEEKKTMYWLYILLAILLFGTGGFLVYRSKKLSQ